MVWRIVVFSARAIPGNEKAYEIGVVKPKEPGGSYTLLWDFWAGGHGLEKVVGKDATKLITSYTCEVTKKQLSKQGFRFNVTARADGGLHVTATK